MTNQDSALWKAASNIESLLPWVTHVDAREAREAEFGAIQRPLHPRLTAKLSELGLTQLYTHQAEAIDRARSGRDVMVVTGTSSGKTLCYAAPVYETLLSEPAARALLLFPTKALAQDQLGRLSAMAPASDLVAATYDGDTPARQRSAIRRNARLVLSNPDMLHVGILPGHENWIPFLKSLRWIVVDEAHTYRGVFGSHMALVMRRLLRLCEHYGSRPQIMMCSATLGNPVELFEGLCGRPCDVVDRNGAPTGPRFTAFVNPANEEGKSPSRNLLAADLLVGLGAAGVRTLTFCRSRVGVELVLRYARKKAEGRSDVAPEQFESYRAGYTPKERRQVESALLNGTLKGLASTNAMELGVDVGGLDAVVVNGYPGTVASFQQQVGRAGRGTREGLAIFLAGDDPLDQYLAQHPKALLDGRSEQVTLNPANPTIVADHLRCAAHEKPLSPTDVMFLAPNGLEIAESLDGSGILEFRGGRFFYPSFEAPAPKVSLRGAGGEQVTLLVDGVELGSMERWRAIQSAHEGAVYLHRGGAFLVTDLNLDTRVATLTGHDSDYFTRPMIQSVVEPLVTLAERPMNGMNASLCGVRVTSDVLGFKRIALDGETALSFEPLDLPTQTFETVGIRLDLDADEGEDPEAFLAGIHGTEHALLALAPFFAGCDRADLGSVWYAAMPDSLKPCLVLFDMAPGGVGLSQKLFDALGSWATAAHSLLEGCECDVGCPRCLYSASCSMSNELLNKVETAQILRRLSDAALGL